MTRKRWRKLIQSFYIKSGSVDGKLLNDLRHSKMIYGYNGELYWENTGTPVCCESYKEHFEMFLTFN